MIKKRKKGVERCENIEQSMVVERGFVIREKLHLQLEVGWVPITRQSGYAQDVHTVICRVDQLNELVKKHLEN